MKMKIQPENDPEVLKMRNYMREIVGIFQRDKLSFEEIGNIVFNLYQKISVVHIMQGFCTIEELKSDLLQLEAAVAFEIQKIKQER